MKKTSYLMSGQNSNGDLVDIDRRALSETERGQVLIVDPHVSELKRNFLKGYFTGLGAEKVVALG